MSARSIDHHRPRRLTAAVLTACCGLAGLWGQPAAAEQRPRTNTKHVCDWEFHSGPRAGQEGKESRVWLGFHPTYDSVAWWPDGSTGTVEMTYLDPLTFQSGDGRQVTWWQQLHAVADGTVVGGEAVLLRSHFGGPTSWTAVYYLDNGGVLECLALDYAALDYIRQAYRRAGAVCDCRSGFSYAAAVGCIEGCAAWWNDDARWFFGPAPDCLGGSKVYPKAGCLLENDPRVDPEPPGF